MTIDSEQKNENNLSEDRENNYKSILPDFSKEFIWI